MMLGVLFCTCLVASNLLETKVVRLWQMPGGHILSVTAGLLVFPISYIINDCIAEVWGYRKARLIIWLGFAMNFLVIILSRVAVMLPAAPFWEGEEAFNFVFGLAPRIAAASLLPFLVGSFLNAILSTLGGESADSLLFFPIAFGGIIPADELLKMIAVQALLKTLYEILILPVTIRVVHYIKRVDETDTYDEGISYNVWKIKEL